MCIIASVASKDVEHKDLGSFSVYHLFPSGDNPEHHRNAARRPTAGSQSELTEQLWADCLVFPDGIALSFWKHVNWQWSFQTWQCLSSCLLALFVCLGSASIFYPPHGWVQVQQLHIPTPLLVDLLR